MRWGGWINLNGEEQSVAPDWPANPQRFSYTNPNSPLELGSMSDTTKPTELTREEAAYVRVVDELFVRLSLYAADTSAGRALLYRLREEVVEAALQEVRADTTHGALLVGISTFLISPP